jgi:hypothetical protein
MEVKRAMRKIEKSIPFILIASLFLFLGAVSAAAQQTKKAASKAAAKSHAMEAAQAKVTGEGKVLGPKETLSGTISTVDKTEKLIVIRGSNGVPYTFRVVRATRITIAGKKATLDELVEQVNKEASVQFVPKTEGNFAQSIEVTG